MKSIKRGQRIITFILLFFIIGMGMLVYKIQTEASFYMSNSSNKSIGMVYDKNGDVLFDGSEDFSKYEAGHFTDVGNIIGDNMGQMSNTLVARNIEKLNNYSFASGLVKSGGKAAIYSTLNHKANRAVYDSFGGRKGCAVAYNYMTGEILICVSRPSFDITQGYDNIAEFESGTLMCKNMYGTVPGSTQKVATLIAGLEIMGKDKLFDKHFSCSGVYLNKSGQEIKCHNLHGHGEQNIVQAFANSCNPFFAQLIEDPDMPLGSIEKVFRALGYAVNSDEEKYIDINGIKCEKASTTLTDSYDFNTQWGCIGQGETLISPVQMMIWQSAVVNESGKTTNPYMIDHVTDVNGKVKEKAKTSYSDLLFAPATASAAKEVMLENGKNYINSISGYEIGVKSGTAQVKNGDEENSLLTGFVNDKRNPIAFCVMIEDKNGGNVKTETITKILLDSLCL